MSLGQIAFGFVVRLKKVMDRTEKDCSVKWRLCSKENERKKTRVLVSFKDMPLVTELSSTGPHLFKGPVFSAVIVSWDTDHVRDHLGLYLCTACQVPISRSSLLLGGKKVSILKETSLERSSKLLLI